MKRSTVNVAGRKVPYLFEGEGTEAVVLLHGLGMKPSVYERLGNLLSDERMVIIPDLTGLRGKEINETLNKLIGESGADTIKVVAHSMGGLFAVGWIANSTKEFQRLILVSSAGERVMRSLFGWGLAAARKAIHSWRHPLTLVRIGASFVLNCILHPSWMLWAFRFTTEGEMVGDLRSFPTPVSLVWAERDEYFPSCSRMAQALKVRPEIVSSANHDWIILELVAASITLRRLLNQSEHFQAH